MLAEPSLAATGEGRRGFGRRPAARAARKAASPMPLSDRLALKAIASEALNWPLPRVLARAETMELGPEGKAPRVLRVVLGGDPPLPEELDELYAAARPGIDVDVRWGTGPSSGVEPKPGSSR